MYHVWDHVLETVPGYLQIQCKKGKQRFHKINLESYLTLQGGLEQETQRGSYEGMRGYTQRGTVYKFKE